MERLRPIPWDELLATMRRRLNEALEQVADAIKDAMLDWGSEGDDGSPATPESHLPPMAPDFLVAAMRGRVEETLRSVAEAVNDCRGATVDSDHEHQIADLFARLGCEAVELALRFRRDAAGVTRTHRHEPHGEWARRLRRMYTEHWAESARQP